MNILVDPSARPIIGHRGASGLAPENTLESFRLALEQGADALEFDVHLSADQVVVVVHDPLLDRTTDRTGPVAVLTVSEIQAADAGARFTPDEGRSYPWRGRGVRVPTLDEVLSAFRETPLLIELKTVESQQVVARTIKAHQAEARCVMAADEAAALQAFRQPPFLCGASRREITRLYFGGLVGLPPSRVGYRALAVPDAFHGLPIPTRRFVGQARRLGCPVHVWTVNDAELARRLWANGAAGMVTNFPGRLRAARTGS